VTAKPELKEAIRSAQAPRANDGGLGAIELIQDLGLLIVIGIGAIALSILSPVFFTRLNIENLLFSSTVIAVIAIGESFVIMVAGIDLSVGAVLALSSVLSVGLVNDFGVPVAAAIAASLGAGALIGLINGLNVTLTKIPALIATLAMLTVTRGLAFIYSGGQNIAPVPDFISGCKRRAYSAFLSSFYSRLRSESLPISSSPRRASDGRFMRLAAIRSQRVSPAFASTASSSSPI